MALVGRMIQEVLALASDAPIDTTALCQARLMLPASMLTKVKAWQQSSVVRRINLCEDACIQDPELKSR